MLLILSWMSSEDHRPGLNTLLLDTLKRKREEDPDNYSSVCLMMSDDMILTEDCQYNHKTKTNAGFVDLGDHVDNTDMASRALVFMLVGLRSHWKVPIGYYMFRSMSDETREVLLVHALEELHERGIKVLCVNSEEPSQTSFPHPVTGETVFSVVTDKRMILGYAEYAMSAYGPLTSATGQINHRYVKLLQTANPNAPKTLSHQVAEAMRACKALSNPEFQHCEATAEYIEVI